MPHGFSYIECDIDRRLQRTTPRPPELRQSGGVRFAVAAALAGIAVLLAVLALRPAAPPLPVLGIVPEFALVASSDEHFARSQLAGRVWVADFIFTTCAGVCPRLSAQMAKVQTALTREGLDDVRLVSFSVDPRTDTPAALREYARRFHADPARWIFLTGSREGLYTLIREGFHLAVAEPTVDENSEAAPIITHTERFVLVDQQAQIRGYYSVLEDEAFRQLLRDVRTLAASGRTGR